VFLTGELDLAVAGDVLAAVRVAIAATPEDGSVVVDVAAVTFMDATGLRALTDAEAEAASLGRGFDVVNLSPPVRRLLALVRFSRWRT